MLNRTPDYDGRFLPYDIKIEIVEHNCGKCPYLTKALTGLNFENFEYELGCSFPTDLQILNLRNREPYLTVVEIAGNGCMFWNSQFLEPYKVESEPDDWSDSVLGIPIIKTEEITIMSRGVLSEDCGVRY